MIKYVKRYKLLSIFVISSLIAFLAGILFNTMIGDKYQDIVSKNINLLISNQFINGKDLLLNNIFITAIVILFGISVIGVIFIFPLYLFKVFIFSFEAISLFTNLGFKNILVVILYLIPNLINLAIYFVICYYALSYSVYLSRSLFSNLKLNMKKITKKYLSISFIAIFLIIISSLLEIFILSKLYLIYV